MPPKAPELDEQQFENLAVLHDLPGQSINSNSILWYFMNSQFYDHGSNNDALINQLKLSPQGQPVLGDRKLFEDALKQRFPLGVQFVVVAEPQGPGQPWVIQRQYKYKPTDANGRTMDRIEVQVQGTYYTVGNRIHMAVNLLDIIQTRLLATSVYLQELFEMSKSLSHYSPATGHTYLPPSYSTAKTAAAGSASRLGTPGLEGDASQTAPTQPPVETSATDFSDNFFLASLDMTNRYGNEFMDENPLLGEPGAFVFKSSARDVAARNAAAQQASVQAVSSAGAPSLALPTSANDQATKSAAATPTPTPKPPPTPLPTDAANRKGSVSKSKRRKSKAGGLTSPTSPTGPGGP